MSKTELVSVVMPAYNAEKFITKALTSLMNQTYGSLEVIVVDDASKDGTKKHVEAIIKSNPDVSVHYYKNSTNKGASATRNHGANLANGTLLLFCDSDDEFTDDHVSSLVNQLQKDKLDAVSALTRHTINESSETLHLKQRRYWGSTEYKLFILGLTGCDLLVKKTVFSALGGFNEKMTYAEDWDLQVRLVHAGNSYATNDGATVRHREHDSSITSNFSWTTYRLKNLLPALLEDKNTTKEQLAIFSFGTMLHAPASIALRLLRETLAYDPFFFFRHPYHVQISISALLQRIRRKAAK